MEVPMKVINAAINGPEVKGIKITELKGSKQHKFNIKPLTLSVSANNDLTVFGQISHDKKNFDNQYWFGFEKKSNNEIIPKNPTIMICKEEVGTIKNKLSSEIKKAIPHIIEAAIGGNIFDKIVGKVLGTKHGLLINAINNAAVKAATTAIENIPGTTPIFAVDNAFIKMGEGHKKSVLNYLTVLSKTIKPPKKLTTPGLTLFEHDMFGGKKKLIKQNENLDNFKKIGWGDKASSLIATVPNGMKLQVFEHHNCKGEVIELSEGTHYIRDLKIHGLGDEISSCQWSKE